MITLQEVIILRISDFRRFFNLGEFWSKKDEFLTLFKQEIARRVETPTKPQEEYFFVDNREEFYLLKKIYEWQMNPSQELFKVNLGSSEVKIETNEGDVIVYPLGRIAEHIENTKKQNRLTNKTILGITLLYLLLNANEHDSDISIEYGEGVNSLGFSHDDIKEFNQCWENVTLNTTSKVEFPLRRCLFVNANRSKVISVVYGNDVVELNPNDCVIGLFSGSNCYKLLINKVTDSDITLNLKINYNGTSTILEVYKSEGVSFIPDVISMAIEPGGYLVYCKSNGEMQYDSQCFALGQRIKNFMKLECSRQLLAFTRDSYGNYILYTTNEINY